MNYFPKNKQIVLFDGFCNLCNNSVYLIIKHDEKDKFRFASLQSEIGKKILSSFQMDCKKSNSIILVESTEQFYTKSTAVLRIAKHLKKYAWMKVFLIVPTFLRDFIYDIIAKNRYKWWGKRKECMVPTRELEEKFL